MSRTAILNSIRQGLGREQASEEERANVLNRIKQHKPVLIPARSQLDQSGKVELFKRMALGASAEIIELQHTKQLPDYVAQWLQRNSFEELVSSDDALFDELDWQPLGDIKLSRRVARSGDKASLTQAYCGIAETGTLMMYSRPESPTTLNFLPDCHLVVLKESEILGSYEEGWQKIRELNNGEMPRTVNLITGPSRSADIGQKLQMGAHGPCVLTIFLIKDL